MKFQELRDNNYFQKWASHEWDMLKDRLMFIEMEWFTEDNADNQIDEIKYFIRSCEDICNMLEYTLISPKLNNYWSYWENRDVFKWEIKKII